MLPRDDRRTRRVLALLLAVSFALITVETQAPNSAPVAALRNAAASVFGPLQQGATTLVRPVEGLQERVGGTRQLAAEVERLRTENSALRGQLSATTVDKAQLAGFSRLLKLAGTGQYKIVPARIIGMGPAQSLSRTITVDAGRNDGIKPDLTVINGEGLVGRVLDAGPHTSTVLLTVDPSVAVGARMEASQEIGIISGTGGSALSLELLNPQARLRPGDRLVTFGSHAGRPYVPGVPIGEVTAVNLATNGPSRRVQIQPFVQFTRLDQVGIVIEQPRQNPRDAVLPSRDGEVQ
ncbi:MAG: rod shape-determining protein MreC [Sporichthyaceae bacterium]|nr:rod shape-determining protein MreC [Sporichthyaceae bacterium]